MRITGLDNSPEYGHAVKLVAPKFVTPYRMSGKRGKNDAADAAAICEAVRRSHMRFVPRAITVSIASEFCSKVILAFFSPTALP